MKRTFCSITVLSGVLLTALVAAPGKDKPAARAGIKTPGIQIPFANVVPEADITVTGTAEWLFAAGSVFAPSAQALDKIDTKANKPGDPVVGLAKPCGGMASAFESLWIPVCGSSSLVRLDARTYAVTATIATGVSSAKNIVAASADSVWMLTDNKTTLSRIDPEQNAVVAEIRLPAGSQGLLFAEGSLWIVAPSKNKVLRLNPATNLVEQQITVSEQPDSLASSKEGIWVLCRKDGKIDRIDPKTNKAAKTIDLMIPDAAGALAYGEGWLWVTLKGFPLTRIDAQQEAVVQQFYGAGGGSIAITPGALWLSSPTANTVTRIDPKRVLATLPD